MGRPLERLSNYLKPNVALKRAAGRRNFDRAASRAAWHFRLDVGAGDHLERCGCAIERDARRACQIVPENLDDSPRGDSSHLAL